MNTYFPSTLWGLSEACPRVRGFPSNPVHPFLGCPPAVTTLPWGCSDLEMKIRVRFSVSRAGGLLGEGKSNNAHGVDRAEGCGWYGHGRSMARLMSEWDASARKRRRSVGV